MYSNPGLWEETQHESGTAQRLHSDRCAGLFSPSRSLQDQRDVVQSRLIDNVPESRDSNVTFPDVFMAIQVTAEFTCEEERTDFRQQG